ncbi:nucleoside phosphorylase domain-containing protein [Aspergillus pseudodeflectus]|uniref:Nucleoside phosphorylase domain-containing protein n=1 Tax=Aspergillus pseudodeflectus TaxID=176178 RepID=A0ABR4KL75_9EURO
MSWSTRLSHGDYLMGWVCALPLEMAAASVMLDEVHQSLPQSPNDSNTYTLGRIGNHNVAIACLPTGIYGVISATASVVQMRFTFPQIQSALMVGIGGGAPTPDVDIRLGDVVVSKPTGTSGGVIQYDYGKTTTGGHLERVGSLDKPPILFLTAVAQLQAKYMIGKGQIAHIVSKKLEENEGMRSTFSCPGKQHDALYQSDYDHPATNKTCTECDNRRIVTRYPRRDNDSLQVHYGLIASGNQVIKHAPTRDKLAKQLGILCFEMEAAGLMDQVPCLVIRGISDYSDSHKNTDWQGYAALTAAAYAKELLSVINGRPSTRAEALQVSNPNTTFYSPQAKHLISGAYNKLRKTVEAMYPEESVAFSDMSIDDVDNKARALERDLAKSEAIRNMRPIIPLLRKLREYSGAIDCLCAGTPYLSWLWAPVWMLLQVSSKDINSLPRLLEAYKHVAEILPTPTMLSNCQSFAESQKILALIYVDVLDFYRGLFMVFENKNWMPLFTTNWKESEDRRELILKNLVEVCECMTQELGTTTIIDMMDRRERRLEEWRKAEQAHTQSRLQSVLAWLDVKDEQEDELDRLYGLQYEGSCSWVFANNKIRRWREAGRENPLVWLTGKPGAGKRPLL